MKYSFSFSKLVLFLIFAHFVVDLTTQFYYFYNRESGIRSLVNLSYFILFFIAVLYTLKTDRLTLFKESYLFLVFSIIPIVLGLFEYNLNGDFASHFFSLIMPILAISLGFNISKNLMEEEIVRFIKRGMNFIYYYSIGTIIFFQGLVNIGVIKYSAINPIGLYTAVLYFLYKKNYYKAVIGLAFVAVSGKRVALLITLVGLIYYLATLIRSNKKYLPYVAGFVLLVSGGFLYLYNSTRYLDRFKLIWQFDITDYNAMLVATGGRSREIIEIIEHLNQNGISWFIGSGFGTSVEIYEGLSRHFSHFSPLAYTMAYGAVFTIFLYYFFLKEISIHKKESFNQLFWFKLVFVGLLASTLFNAVAFIDPKYWVIYGITKYYNLEHVNSEP
ncbi:hypothetical protein SAMN05421743_10866 [Thalassobacillus cyri]|uniref:O-Antigen ligase n=1 Tax=Thalassobacillus cyri TaxID=571932 RepID=A0A1H4DZV5_9BACI|nr:hypothetical protein [Thalassobacillus cyri]SEA78048.1 hypothetical protein SAMN05421743_10866 [Thalassobacillus cyri]